MNLNEIINDSIWLDISVYTEMIIKGVLWYLPKIIWAILIIVIGFWIVKRINKIFRKTMEKSNVDVMLKSFLSSVFSIILKIIVFISAAWMLWVETSSFVAMLAAAWLAIGMSLSWTLQNFAWWIIILMFKPYKIWDFVEVWGFSWNVKEIHIFNTIIITPDEKTIIVPNSDISNGSMTNYSTQALRRVDLIIWVSYSDDIDLVKETLKEISESDERILQDQEITIWVWNLWESSVDFNFRFYVETDNYWPVKFDTLEKVKKTFDKKWITFPFPQRDVHMYNKK